MGSVGHVRVLGVFGWLRASILRDQLVVPGPAVPAVPPVVTPPPPQLAMYSIAFYLPVALNEEGALFDGWTANAVILAVLGSAGGLLVALTMKYTDAVLKTFATSGAIIVTAVAGHMFLQAPLDIPIGVGAGCTVLSLINYSDDGSLPPADGSEKDKGSGKTGGGAGARQAAAKHDKTVNPDDESSQSLIARTTGSPRDSAA